MISYTDLLHVVLLLTQTVFTSAQCNGGYVKVNGVGPCTACAPGKFHEASGSNRCVDCATGTYSTTVAAKSESTCIQCNSDAGLGTPEQGSTKCVCGAGFYGPNGTAPCTRCPSGKVTQEFAMTECVTCPEGSHSNKWNYNCETCPDTQVQAPGGDRWDTCVCKAGFVLYESQASVDEWCPTCKAIEFGCKGCQPGYFQDKIGQSSCIECHTGTSSSYHATTCVGCPDNMWFWTSMNMCICNKGYIGPRGGPCTPCAAGTYEPLTGKTIEEGGCSNCQPGSYQDQLGQSSCVECVVGTYSDKSAATACVTCPDTTTSNIPRDACVCNAGYTGPDFGPCTSCAPGTFKDTTGSADCTDCPSGTYTTTPAAKECLICGEHSSTPPRSSSADACVCENGFGIE